MTWKIIYERWKEAQLDEELRSHLQQLEKDEKLLEDCFYKTTNNKWHREYSSFPRHSCRQDNWSFRCNRTKVPKYYDS